MAYTSDGRLIKLANTRIKYTKTEVDELLGCLDLDNGPIYFMTNFMYIQHPTRGREKFVPYDYQIELVESYHHYRKSVNMLGRQLGKTTMAVAYLLWFAMFTPDSTILIASNKHDGALEIMQRVRYVYENVPDHIRAGVITYNKKSIEFDNNSRIIAQTTTHNTGRGMSLSLVYLDEFAFVEHHIAKQFWTSLSPTLSTGGKCIITSTPDTDEDQFSEIWAGANRTIDEYGNETDVGINGFKAFFADWSVHPERDEAWAAEQRGDLGEARFDREHACRFITFEETLINPIKLADIPGSTPIRKSGQVRWYSEINPHSMYVVGLDPSMGTGGDNAAIQVLELPSLVQVAEWQHNGTLVEDQVKVMRDILVEIYESGKPELYWSVENNTIGEAALVVIRDTGEDRFPGTMLHDPVKTTAGKRKGFTTTNKTKLEMCAKLKSLVETRKMDVRSKNLLAEMKTFVAKSNTFISRPGFTDDLIMAMLLVLRMAVYISSWDDRSYEQFNSNILDKDAFDDFDQPLPMIII